MNRRRLLPTLLIFAFFPFLGCGEQRKPYVMPPTPIEDGMYVPPGKEGPTRPVVPRKKIVKKPSINFIDFEFQKKTEFPASYISIVNLKNRGNVLKIKSELDTKAGRLPQYYVHAVVDAESLQDVLGQEIKAQMFVQTSNDGGIWSHKDLVKITVEQKDAFYNVSMQGQLRNTKTGKVEFTTANLACLDISKQ